jgi:hypothetical protein
MREHATAAHHVGLRFDTPFTASRELFQADRGILTVGEDAGMRRIIFSKCSTRTLSLCVNLSESEVDKREMLGTREGRQTGPWDGKRQDFGLALELLAGCGMISGAGFKTPSDYPRCGALSPSKDYTLAILESLNLSDGKRV